MAMAMAMSHPTLMHYYNPGCSCFLVIIGGSTIASSSLSDPDTITHAANKTAAGLLPLLLRLNACNDTCALIQLIGQVQKWFLDSYDCQAVMGKPGQPIRIMHLLPGRFHLARAGPKLERPCCPAMLSPQPQKAPHNDQQQYMPRSGIFLNAYIKHKCMTQRLPSFLQSPAKLIR